MFSFLVATTVAISSVSVDGIFGKKGSCSNSSCSASVAEKPAVVEKKVEAKNCTSSCSEKSKKHFKHFVFRKSCKS